MSFHVVRFAPPHVGLAGDPSLRLCWYSPKVCAEATAPTAGEVLKIAAGAAAIGTLTFGVVKWIQQLAKPRRRR